LRSKNVRLGSVDDKELKRMKIIEIASKQTLTLRQRILRQKLKPQECYFPGDDDATTFHLGCKVDNQLMPEQQEDDLVGIVSMYKRANDEVHSGCGYQIRAMASDERMRGKGVGLKLLVAAQSKAFDNGADYIWANARTAAVGFYQKAGYKVHGAEFEIPGVGPHYLVSHRCVNARS